MGSTLPSGSRWASAAAENGGRPSVQLLEEINNQVLPTGEGQDDQSGGQQYDREREGNQCQAFHHRAPHRTKMGNYLRGSSDFKHAGPFQTCVADAR